MNGRNFESSSLASMQQLAGVELLHRNTNAKAPSLLSALCNCCSADLDVTSESPFRYSSISSVCHDYSWEELRYL